MCSRGFDKERADTWSLSEQRLARSSISQTPKSLFANFLVAGIHQNHFLVPVSCKFSFSFVVGPVSGKRNSVCAEL